MLRGAGPVALASRLALVVGFVFLGAALLAYIRKSPPSLAAAKPAIAGLFPADSSIAQRVDRNVGVAAAISWPLPETNSAIQGIERHRLDEAFRRGMAMMRDSPDDSTKSEGARLVNAAAILGNEPARALIARDYPTTAVIRSAVSAREAVRYSLDPLLAPDKQSESRLAFLVILASYFSGRHALADYATELLAALSNDRRLQTDDRLKSLLQQLARVPGACTAIGRAASKARMVTGPECSANLQLQIANYIRTTTPEAADAESRRLALQLLESDTADEGVSGQ